MNIKTPQAPVISYQVLSRNNDRNGRPYRLAIIYINAQSILTIEFRESEVLEMLHKIIGEIFKRETFQGMPWFHLAPAEYNNVKSCYKQLDKFWEYNPDLTEAKAIVNEFKGY